jgi:dihydrofolate reductase
MINLIAALDEDGLIGQGAGMPWNLPEDLQHFRRTTMDHTVILGRKTWEGFAGRSVLDGRVNFVVTRQPALWAERVAASDPEGPHFVDTIELAVRTAKRRFPEFVEEVFICGGRELYELALRRGLVERMILSHVKGRHIGDVRFPPFGDHWQGKTLAEYDGFTVVEYLPTKSSPS